MVAILQMASSLTVRGLAQSLLENDFVALALIIVMRTPGITSPIFSDPRPRHIISRHNVENFDIVLSRGNSPAKIQPQNLQG